MWEEIKEMDLACEEAACACDDIAGSIDALDDFSILPEDSRPESEGGVPSDIDASPDDGRDPWDHEDPDFDGLADYEEMF